MKLLAPVPYRLKPAHRALLRRMALKDGHTNHALSLRMVLDQAVLNERLSKNGHGKRSE